MSGLGLGEIGGRPFTEKSSAWGSHVLRARGGGGTQGAPSDMEIQLREVLSLTRRMAEVIAHHSGQSVERVTRDIDRDLFMTADETLAYGLIDGIVHPQRGLGRPS